MKREETVDHHIKATWHSISRMYNQRAAEFDASMAEGFALLNISSEEGTPATKIGPLMGLEARSITRIIKRLLDEGMIVKKKDASDGRTVKIFLTPEGQQKKEIAANTVLNFNNRVREEIADDQLAVFFEVMEKINQIVEEQVENINGLSNEQSN